jgi:hypothetical protein
LNKTENCFSPYPRSEGDINLYRRLQIAMQCLVNTVIFLQGGRAKLPGKAAGQGSMAIARVQYAPLSQFGDLPLRLIAQRACSLVSCYCSLVSCHCSLVSCHCSLVSCHCMAVRYHATASWYPATAVWYPATGAGQQLPSACSLVSCHCK